MEILLKRVNDTHVSSFSFSLQTTVSVLTDENKVMSTNSSWWLSIIWQAIFSGLYFLVPIAGVSLNFYVLKKLGKIARLNGYRFETSSGIALFGMAVSDSICLISIFTQTLFHVVFRFLDIREGSQAATFFCKIDLYVLHTTSAFSVWSWLVLSILRYTAVFFPFRYRTIWNQPRIALMCLIAFTATFELWILFFVAYQPQQQSCSEASGTNHMIIQTAHLFDISVQYVLPAFIRIVLDGVVLFHCYKPNVVEVPIQTRRFGISAPCGSHPSDMLEGRANSMSLILSLSRQSNSSIRNHPIHSKKTSMIKRSLIISVLNLCCNLPAHILRALWTIEAGERLLPERWLIFFEGVSQILYFSQFTSNALYLSTTIYETSTAPTRPCALLTTQQSNNSTVTIPAPGQSNKTILYADFV
ncbi:putative G-protein coupled receptor AH9.4 [Aphelenchoides besseyi]|nr:putative G-protein coupled receptor AH9.4 [Aphelenchoides besseyi]